MGAAERLSPFVPEADYLQQERLADHKSEYFQGEIRAMAGATLVHNQLVANLIIALGTRSRSRGCQTFGSDLRVHVPATSFYTYPDVVVVCGKPQVLDHTFDTLLNPTLLVEVLSPGTRTYDIGEKSERYRAIASLQHYLVVDSTQLYVALLTRGERPGNWLLTETWSADDEIALPALGIEVPLSEVYLATGL